MVKLALRSGGRHAVFLPHLRGSIPGGAEFTARLGQVRGPGGKPIVSRGVGKPRDVNWLVAPPNSAETFPRLARAWRLERLLAALKNLGANARIQREHKGAGEFRPAQTAGDFRKSGRRELRGRGA